MNDTRKVTYRQLEKGQLIAGTEQGNSRASFKAYVKDVNPAYVTVEMWRKGGAEDRIRSDGYFLIPLSDDEYVLKYNRKAGEILDALQQKLSLDEAGAKTQWNSWLSSNPWELAQFCTEKKLTIRGHCTDIAPKRSWGGDLLDVGICAEDEDGDRFWCHFRGSTIEKMLRMYDRYQGYIREGKIRSAQYSHIAFQIEEEIANEQAGGEGYAV